ncbi:MAG TPA: hypothetical protein VFE47_01335 [Tepidisphaeraceae bacterium]|jgi:hypothetical protein|nr:hypothetical protein [Tepidisphaeraceae bacterium]
MIQEIADLLPDAASRIHAPVAFSLAAVGLLLALTGARFSRAIISLSLVSAGTVIGLHMPKWFGWGIDPMGTAFGMAIVLGMSGYVLTTLWEGIFFAALLAGGAAMIAWMNLAPHQSWHLPQIDWSATAIEIAGKVRLSLPPALTTVLPVALGIGATVGALLMVIWHKLGRVLFYSTLGMSILTLGAMLAIRQTHGEWLGEIPRDPYVQGGIFCLLIIVASAVQWMLLPRDVKPAQAPTSENKLYLNQFVANGPALRVKAAEARILAAGAVARPARPAAGPVSSRIR